MLEPGSKGGSSVGGAASATCAGEAGGVGCDAGGVGEAGSDCGVG